MQQGATRIIIDLRNMVEKATWISDLNMPSQKELWMYYLLYTTFKSLYSKKLHIFGLRARTVVIKSRVIFFFSFWLLAVYHFCNLSLP